ncbi:MAG: ribonuclease III, partial [Lachnospiraceae bacterium]|nr:ribonuclease III [Lachnospiraceae bacterium]
MEKGSRLKELEEKIGYHFQNPELLKTAMCHSSYANERHMGRLNCNERLEFLGDAVLELATSEFLYERY